MPGFLCGNAGSGRISRQVGGGVRCGGGARRARREATGNERAPRGRLISAKNRWILPKGIKDSVDLPDFVKESVAQIQILCTFQAGFEVWRVLKCGGF